MGKGKVEMREARIGGREGEVGDEGKGSTDGSTERFGFLGLGRGRVVLPITLPRFLLLRLGLLYCSLLCEALLLTRKED